MSVELSRFASELRRRCPEADRAWRPFVYDGSPLNCQAFITGYNAATTMAKPFWSYWNDERGFDKAALLVDMGKLSQTRRRIERIVQGAPGIRILETNLYAQASKRERDLRKAARQCEVIDFLVLTSWLRRSSRG